MAQVKRCAEMARKLRFFKDQIQKADLRISTGGTTEKELDLDELEVGICKRFYPSSQRMQVLCLHQSSGTCVNFCLL